MDQETPLSVAPVGDVLAVRVTLLPTLTVDVPLMEIDVTDIIDDSCTSMYMAKQWTGSVL